MPTAHWPRPSVPRCGQTGATGLLVQLAQPLVRAPRARAPGPTGLSAPLRLRLLIRAALVVALCSVALAASCSPGEGPDGSGGCALCGAGTYSTSGAACVSCTAHCVTCGSTDGVCTACASGYIVAGGGSSCRTDQKGALMALYAATGGGSWGSSTGWGVGEPCALPNWHGVTVCSGDNIV